MPHRKLLMFAVGFVSFCCALPYANGGEVPFTPAGIASLMGQDICNLRGEFPKQLGVYLDRQKEHAVQHRERNGVSAVFLLGRPLTPICGIVNAVLDLTPLIKKGETLEFKCYTNHRGGTTWGKWGHVIGLANNQGGKKRFVRARLAWRVNIKEKRFEVINDETVNCDTSGYED